jgi:hypothetical protein
VAARSGGGGSSGSGEAPLRISLFMVPGRALEVERPHVRRGLVLLHGRRFKVCKPEALKYSALVFASKTQRASRQSSSSQSSSVRALLCTAYKVSEYVPAS